MQCYLSLTPALEQKVTVEMYFINAKDFLLLTDCKCMITLQNGHIFFAEYPRWFVNSDVPCKSVIIAAKDVATLTSFFWLMS